MKNLLPHLSEFTSWSPTPGQTPEFIKEPEVLGMCGGSNINSFGKWVGVVPVFVGKQCYYNFMVC